MVLACFHSCTQHATYPIGDSYRQLSWEYTLHGGPGQVWGKGPPWSALPVSC